INVMTENEAEDKREQEIDSLVEHFIQHLDIEDDLARLLVEEGFTTLEEIAYVPLEEILEIEELDEELVEDLRARAKDELLNLAIASEEALDGAQPADDLLEMEGMERHLAFILASRGIVTMEDLAEQSVDDLMDIEGMDEERAASLIMTARAPWFENEQ
ncbi:helix-hairpin-helix domain-containing protein, partial [Halomonas sp. BC04]